MATTKQIKTRIYHKIDTAENYAASNFKPERGEIVIVEDEATGTAKDIFFLY